MKNVQNKKDSFGRLDLPTDATGKMLNVEGTKIVPKKKPVQSEKDRKKSILEKGNLNFTVTSSSDADGSKPFYAIDNFSEVGANKEIIEREARKAKIDPDLVKAIMHLETTQGAYDRLKFGSEQSIRPMNIHAEYWKGLGFSRQDLKDPEKNIQAGVELLKRIQKRMPGASVAKVATVYNNLKATKVSNYGARTEQLYKEKPWEK